MFRIEVYIEELLALLKNIFGERLVYMGLQGSYLRNEQNENSDIDIMAVIDKLNAKDLDLYRDVLLKVGYYEKSCGFICGKDDLKNWNPLEICHLLHATKDIYGNLSELVPYYTQEDEKNYIKVSIGNLYHELCHRYIYSNREKNMIKLPLTCKSIFFILQNLHYIEKGTFYNSKTELLGHLEGRDKDVMAMSLNLQNSDEYDFDYAFDLLLSWCQNTLMRLNSKTI